MFNEAGQLVHGFVCRGGGGKGGGGGGGAMGALPQVYTDPVNGMTFTDNVWSHIPGLDAPLAGADALNAEIQQRQATEKQQSDAAKAAQDAANAQAESTFQTNRQNAADAALQSVMQTFRGQGVDPTGYMSYINPAIQAASASVPDLASNPAAYFSPSLGQTILNQATGDRRTQLTNTLNATFNPTYSTTSLPDSTMDASVADILSRQFDPLSSQLLNAKNRGTLTDAGYAAALDKLSQSRSGAESQLRSLGQTILSNDRGALDALASGARSDIAGMSLGQNIDPNSYFTQGQSLINSDISGFPGALQSASGDITFADIQDLLNAGGAVQGANNPTASNPGGGTGQIGGQGNPNDPSLNQDPTIKRGLGNTGAF